MLPLFSLKLHRQKCNYIFETTLKVKSPYFDVPILCIFRFTLRYH